MTQPSPTATSTNSDQRAQAAADWSEIDARPLGGLGAFILIISWFAGFLADGVSASWVLPSSLLGMFLYVWCVLHHVRESVDLRQSKKSRDLQFAYGAALLLVVACGSTFVEGMSLLDYLHLPALLFLAAEVDWRIDKRHAERDPLSPATVARWDRWLHKSFCVLALFPFLLASIRLEGDLSGALSLVAGGGEPWLVLAIGLVTAATACFAPIPSKKVSFVVLGASLLALFAWNASAWINLEGGRGNTGAQILLGLFPLLGLFVLVLAKGRRFNRITFRLASLIWMAWLLGPAFPIWST